MTTAEPIAGLQYEEPIRRDWKLLAIALLGYAAIYLVFYPPLPGVIDEIGYVNQATLWSRGAVSAEGAGIKSAGDFAFVRGRHVSYRHPGMSLLLLPFIKAGGGMFVLGLVVQIAIAVTSARILTQWRVSPLWALLVLFHPTLLLFSRTAMADGVATLMVLSAFLALYSMKRPHLMMGLVLGFATATRMQSAMFLIALGTWTLLHRDYRGVLQMAAASLLSGVPLVIYNWNLFHTLTGYQFSDGFISAAHIRNNVPFDLLALTCIWPLMLPIAVLNRRLPKWSAVMAAVTVHLALLACYHHRDQGASLLETLVVWPRLLQPIIPLLILSFCHALATRIHRPLPGVIIAVVIVACLAGQSAVFHRHQNHLNALVAAKEETYWKLQPSSHVIMNAQALKLVGVIDRNHGGFPGFVLYSEDISDLWADPVFADPSFDAVLWLNRGDSSVSETAVARLTAGGYSRVETTAPGLMLWKRSRP